jgi:hypothetical protein
LALDLGADMKNAVHDVNGIFVAANRKESISELASRHQR